MERALKFTLVDTEEGLTEAIKELEGHTTLGLNCEGVSLGRRGKICLVNITTPQMTYLFDVTVLGSHVFGAGLKTILESNSITKIIHDARTDSDALYHQYRVVLTNTFDTQVADVMVRRNITKNMPKYLSNYTHCLRVFLGFTYEDTTLKSVEKEMMSQDPEMYDRRPLDPQNLIQASFGVSFLFDLKECFQKLLMLEFSIACDQYLRVKRNLSDMEVAKFENSPQGMTVDQEFIPRPMLEARYRPFKTPPKRFDGTTQREETEETDEASS